jgi:glycosyltransferase involved in cell wall biosynthesis
MAAGFSQVTIVIPTFNGESFVSDALSSARKQTHEDLEILIVDDCSTDGTLDVVSAHARQDNRVRVVQNGTRLGLAANFNQCLYLAENSWVKYLLQDDTLSPSCVEQMMAARRSGCPLVICGRRYEYEGVIEESRRNGYEHLLDVCIAHSLSKPGWVSPNCFAYLFLDHWTRVNFIGEPVAVLLDRDVAISCGGFDERFLVAVDLELFVRLGLRYGAAVVPDVLATFRCHGIQASALLLQERWFHMVVLDPALFSLTVAFSPQYSELRRLAQLRDPSVDVRHVALGEAADALRMAWTPHSAPRALVGPHAYMQWKSILRDDPVVGRYVSAGRLLLSLAQPSVRQGFLYGRRLAGMVVRLHPRGDEAIKWLRRATTSRTK